MPHWLSTKCWHIKKPRERKGDSSNCLQMNELVLTLPFTARQRSEQPVRHLVSQGVSAAVWGLGKNTLASHETFNSSIGPGENVHVSCTLKVMLGRCDPNRCCANIPTIIWSHRHPPPYVWVNWILGPFTHTQLYHWFTKPQFQSQSLNSSVTHSGGPQGPQLWYHKDWPLSH